MSGTRFSKMLRLMTQKEFTHASIALDPDLSKLYSFGRRSMAMPLMAGFVRENVNGGVFDKYDAKCEILRLRVSQEKYKLVEQEIEKYKNAYSDYKYNLMGLPFMWFDIPYERDNHLVCSQFVASVLLFSGVHEFNKSWTLIRPMDFKEIKSAEVIYRGALREYMDENSKDDMDDDLNYINMDDM